MARNSKYDNFGQDGEHLRMVRRVSIFLDGGGDASFRLRTFDLPQVEAELVADCTEHARVQ